jgi:hypothetical protein
LWSFFHSFADFIVFLFLSLIASAFLSLIRSILLPLSSFFPSLSLSLLLPQVFNFSRLALYLLLRFYFRNFPSLFPFRLLLSFLLIYLAASDASCLSVVSTKRICFSFRCNSNQVRLALRIKHQFSTKTRSLNKIAEVFQFRYHKTASKKISNSAQLGGRPLVFDGRVVDPPSQLLTQCCVLLYHPWGLTKHQNGLTTALVLLNFLDQEWTNGRYDTTRVDPPPAKFEHVIRITEQSLQFLDCSSPLVLPPTPREGQKIHLFWQQNDK